MIRYSDYEMGIFEGYGDEEIDRGRPVGKDGFLVPDSAAELDDMIDPETGLVYL